MPTDLERLQGTWNVTSLETDGQPITSIALTGATITIANQRFKSTGMGADYEGRVEIDETAKPKTFDLVFTAGPEKGNRNLGIYRLTGKTWTLCLATRGDRRPATFATVPGSGFALEILQRDAAVGKPRKTKKAVEESSPSGTPTELEGEWAMVSAVFNGVPMEDSAVKWCKRLTRGNVTSVVAGPQVFLKAKFKLDSSAEPKRIDYMNLAGSAAGKSQEGIFEFADGLLKICVSAPGKSRPSEFSSKKGDGRSFTVWRRI